MTEALTVCVCELYNQRTPWCRAFLENVKVTQLTKMLPSLMDTKYALLFAEACHTHPTII